MIRFPLYIGMAAATFAIAGCASTSTTSSETSSGAKATAKLTSTKGNTASGTVTFLQRGDTVFVKADVTGLKPNAEHGFHVHEKGDCSSGDGMSAGGHFNPGGSAHGSHGATPQHAGDLPSLRADSYGNATLSFETKMLAVGKGASDVVGKGVIVHRDPDDYKSQPAGNAGPRIACAVVERS
jgi:Cu-Zn family superoxide dismutase